MFSNIAIRLIIFLVVGGAVAIGGFIFRDISSGHVGDLAVGDCFDVPTGVETIKDVQHHPCKEAHTAELFAVFEYPGQGSDAYPAEAALQNYAESVCVTSFRTYTGRDPITDPLLTLGWMYPTENGWKNGDHGLNCYLERVDSLKMNQSYRISAP